MSRGCLQTIGSAARKIDRHLRYGPFIQPRRGIFGKSIQRKQQKKTDGDHKKEHMREGRLPLSLGRRERRVLDGFLGISEYEMFVAEIVHECGEDAAYELGEKI